MRRLLPLALLLAACAKPAEAPKAEAPAPPAVVEKTDGTPEEMAKAMDVPIYPGAEAPDGLSKVPEKRVDGGMSYSMTLATTDPVAKVGAWYGKTLGLTAMPSKGGMTIVGMTKGGNQAIITVGPEGGRTLIRAKAITYPKLK